MILQKILFPSADVCSRGQMYFTGESIAVLMEEKCCKIPKGAVAVSNTYFNSFSIGKWKKYTVLSNLKLRLSVKGEVQVCVHHACKMNNTIKDKIIAEKSITADQISDVIIPVPTDENSGIYYFELRSLSDGAQLFGGAYETDIDSSTLHDVKVAVGICTFRREIYVAHNMQVLRKEILENPESPMYQKLEIFISDNSKTLDSSLETESIHIFPNRNLGGAGGFTRSMIEIKKVSEERGITHILLMDDDVRLNPDSLLRTYTMLRLLKKEHRDVFIGGHMLKIDAPHMQSEAADHWNIVTQHPVKYNYNLERLDFIIKNEVEDSVNYLSWWYCCMPVNIVSDTNLPMPVFIKRDDIEYGLRNGKEFVTMNGICVWHEPFEYKSASYLEYYYFRNLCIMNARHRLSFTSKRLIKEIRNRVKGHLLRYRYKDAELSLIGVQHYLNGIDWLKKQDAEKLNGQIMKLGYKKEPIDKIDFVFIHGLYERNLNVEVSRKRKILRRLTLNGWLLPANGNIIAPAYQPDTALFYRARRVLNYEEISNMGFVTQRDRHSLLYILKLLRKTEKAIRKNYKRVTQEYRDRFDELTNIEFWNDYLFNPGETDKIISGLDKPRRPKNSKNQRRQYAKSVCLRIMQVLLFWLPLKKRRVMVSVHDRKGFTCNPKYVVKKLMEKFGDKLEVIWVTSYPETCKEVEELGVKIIRQGSSEHIRKYLRTKFYITNDAFPSWALRRGGQKWLNTWHGAMNYKHIGPAALVPRSRLGMKLFMLENRQPNFFLSGSEFFTKNTADSFKLSEKCFVPSGLPRNDALFTEHKELSKKVRKYYHIADDTRLAIFAPTFRRGMKSNTYGMNFDMVRTALKERFGGEWAIMFRNHNFVKGQNNYSGTIDVSTYHDMQELMCAADVLISDYSSCLYDFVLTKKPAFVYASDLNNYMTNDRSFAYPFEKWPYPAATSNEQLVEKIKNFDEKDFEAKVEEHFKDVGAYDNGTASEQVADLVEKYCL